MSLTKQARSRNPDDFPTLQLFLLGEIPPLHFSDLAGLILFPSYCSPGRADRSYVHFPLRLGSRQEV